MFGPLLVDRGTCVLGLKARVSQHRHRSHMVIMCGERMMGDEETLWSLASPVGELPKAVEFTVVFFEPRG